MQQRYTNVAIIFHWLVALMIIGAFSMGLFMTDMAVSPAKLKYYSWHKWTGVTILALATLRLLWRLGHPAPAYPASMPAWQKSSANILHGMLYVLMFAVPVSGYFYTLAAGYPVVYFGLFKLPVLIEKNAELKPVLQAVHFWLNMTLAGAVGVHIAAALKHQFIDRDGVLKRMLPKA
ncbi:cytochrome b [Massilia sp. TSP1-1-2]|uniref:cytochrome b n=1 Tax=unclassified Massilia TaxID=2609279 RepID=UPI003CEF7853